MDLNIREFPDDLNRKLRTMAAIECTTLRDLIIQAAKKLYDDYGARNPNLEDVIRERSERE